LEALIRDQLRWFSRMDVLLVQSDSLRLALDALAAMTELTRRRQSRSGLSSCHGKGR
jgi:hypothetical protein